MEGRWLDLDGVVNARVLGDGLVRADNLQDLSEADVRLLVERERVRLVVDLRTEYEVAAEGPGPLTREPRVRIEHRSLHPETGGGTDLDASTVDPWQVDADGHDPDEAPAVRAYLGYLRHRPESVAAAVRAIARAPDGVLVHCAAGKDRTGVVVALALEAAGVPRDDIVADYLRTAERIEAIVARLAASPTYAGEVDSADAQRHAPKPGTMERLLALVDERHGGAGGWLLAHGLAEDDLARLRARLGP
jgi:hypothetical protein